MNKSASKYTYITIGVFTLVLVLVAGGYIYIDSQAPDREMAAHFSPAASILNAEASISYYEDRLRKTPDDQSSQLALAQLYLQHARATRQEALYLPRAQRLLDTVLADSPDHYQARALQASLYNTLHQFERARDLTQTLLLEEEHHAYVYGILVDALVELGEYEAAVAACDRMIELRPSVASYARAAYLRELHGDAAGAMQAMRMAAEAGVPGHQDRSWALYQIGQLYLGQNEVDAAMGLFEGILDEHAGYSFAIGGLGQVSLLRGSYEEALYLFERAYTMMPDDRFLEGQLEVYAMLGDEEAAGRIESLLEESYRSAADMGENVRMEYADFMADLDQNLDKSLEMARAEYERRPNHLHALETYAWTLHKNGRSEEAIPYIERTMRLNTGDAMVHFRAAQIYAGASRTVEAEQQLQQALDAHLHIESPSASRKAELWLAKLG